MGDENFFEPPVTNRGVVNTLKSDKINDLDVRIFPTGSFKILDRREYAYHKKKMAYSKQLDSILKRELSTLIEMIRQVDYFFQPETIEKYVNMYQLEVKKSKEKMAL